MAYLFYTHYINITNTHILNTHILNTHILNTRPPGTHAYKEGEGPPGPSPAYIQNSEPHKAARHHINTLFT